MGESNGDRKITRAREWGTVRERIARDRPRRAIEGVWVGKSRGLDRGGVAAVDQVLVMLREPGGQHGL